MDQKALNDFCRSLPATTHVVQWGGSDVWKVGGKVFSIAGYPSAKEIEKNPARKGFYQVTFKVSDIAFEILRETEGCRPAPYLASRGMKWIQYFDQPGLSAAALKDYIKTSHKIVANGLSRKKQQALGLEGL